MSKFEELLKLYTDKKYPTLLTKALEIVRQEGIIITKTPVVYEVIKEEGYAHAYIIVNLYVDSWKVYLKINDKDEVEKGVYR